MQSTQLSSLNPNWRFVGMWFDVPIVSLLASAELASGGVSYSRHGDGWMSNGVKLERREQQKKPWDLFRNHDGNRNRSSRELLSLDNRNEFLTQILKLLLAHSRSCMHQSLVHLCKRLEPVLFSVGQNCKINHASQQHNEIRCC